MPLPMEQQTPRPRDPPPGTEAEPDATYLLSVPQAAARLKLSRSMLYALMDRGELEYVVIGRCRRIRPAALAELIKASTRRG